MNRGVVQSSPVQQMMASNPNWWNININNMRPPSPQPSPNFFSTPSNFLIPNYTPNSSSLPFPSWQDNHQELPESWSQLLMSGIVGEEDRIGMSQFQNQMLISQAPNASLVDVKQESSGNSYAYGHGNEELSSCVTSFNTNNMLDFSNNNNNIEVRHPPQDRSSECNSSASGGAMKKARVQQATTQTTFKVRKEKLGDRITALHQLVSPFGKTDTASVLLEAIGYIRFLQSQIEALSLPYLNNGSGNTRQQHSLLNENSLKRKAVEEVSQQEPKKDLKSRGLCLVPVSCTLQVGSDNGADYWAPALGGGFQ
ncbi:hypothetical protein TSUD_141490 [Trifolium subterraneum]|uniref:BHLH domain-containing protein n=1 Tax=Trifolium subterraneum TaxID=3900 RepID=A0A2Z6PVC9_TRISU|nr:hypothetical protein TSUD_141490 [Trifolium subterraneum]